MLVRRPARHSLFLETEPVDFSEYERHDIDHVRNKYPKAQDTIIKRLGLAITRRRKTLRYRERHHAKLGRGLDTGNDTMSVLSDTIATTLSIQEIGLEEGSSRTDFSQTSFAPSLSSGGNPTVPNPPKILSEEPLLNVRTAFTSSAFQTLTRGSNTYSLTYAHTFARP